MRLCQQVQDEVRGRKCSPTLKTSCSDAVNASDHEDSPSDDDELQAGDSTNGLGSGPDAQNPTTPNTSPANTPDALIPKTTDTNAAL